MFKKQFSFLAIMALLVAVLAACGQTATSGSGSISAVTSPAGRAERVVYSPTSGKDALETVRAYNTALIDRNMNRALNYLAYEVVFVEQSEGSCAPQVISGQQAVEAYLRNASVLSRWVGEYHAEGNRVTYHMTEWLDPRIVGPVYPQPRESIVVAVVENGEIVSAVIQREQPGGQDLGKGGVLAVNCKSLA